MANDRLELCKSTSACSWGSRQKSCYIKDKRELNSKIHLAVNERGLPVKFIVTEGTRANCKEAINLLKNLDAKLLFADRAYDTNEVLAYIAKRNTKSVISPKRNRLEQRDYKGFRALNKRDISLTVNFIALDILSRILSLLLNVGAVSPPDTLKHSMLSSLLFMFVVSLCICHSFKFFSCRHYLDSF